MDVNDASNERWGTSNGSLSCIDQGMARLGASVKLAEPPPADTLQRDGCPTLPLLVDSA